MSARRTALRAAPATRPRHVQVVFTSERLTLPDQDLDTDEAVDHLYDRWKDTSPLFRAGHDILAYLEHRGIDLGAIWLHGQQVGDEPATHFADFDLRYFRSVPWLLAEAEAVEWLAIVHTTRYQPLDVLRIIPLDRARLATAD